MTDPLERWFRALARAGEQPATLTFIGDSFTAGAWASGGGRRKGSDRRPSRRYANLVAHALSARFTKMGPEDQWTGAGWFEIERTTQYMRFGWDHVGGSHCECGLGSHGRRLARGDEVRHRALCDAVDLFFTTDPNGGALEVAIDDEVVATFETAAGEPGSGRRWRSAPLPSAWHEVRVRCVDSQGRDARIDGGYFHTGTRARGVEVFVGGHNGWTTADAMRDRGSIDHLSLNPPDLVVWFTGTNDYGAGAQQFGRDLRDAVDIVTRTCPGADRALVFPFAPAVRTDWDEFRAEAVGAADHGRAALVDLHAFVGSRSPTAESGLWAQDGAHPSDAGHRVIADAILATIVPDPAV